MKYIYNFGGQSCYKCKQTMYGEGVLADHPSGGVTSFHPDCYEKYTTELREALNWLVHLHHGVSKGGPEFSPPSDAEWQDALETAKKLLGDET